MVIWHLQKDMLLLSSTKYKNNVKTKPNRKKAFYFISVYHSRQTVPSDLLSYSAQEPYQKHLIYKQIIRTSNFRENDAKYLWACLHMQSQLLTEIMHVLTWPLLLNMKTIADEISCSFLLFSAASQLCLPLICTGTQKCVEIAELCHDMDKQNKKLYQHKTSLFCNRDQHIE